jgi:hypothetical protein
MTPLSIRKSISAALRHVCDAEHLMDPGEHQSLDQSYHLAGFGPECARKACLHERWADKALGHRDAEVDAKLVLEVLLSVDGHAHRYRVEGWESYLELQQWDPSSRYEATGTHDEVTVRTLIEECRAIVDPITTALWADGLLEEIP